MADNVLDQARARLDGGKKWQKYGLTGIYGRVCLVQALGEASRGSGVTLYKGLKAVIDVVAEQYPDRGLDRNDHPRLGVSIPAFNDHPDTTWADIEAVLDKAARRLDEQL